MTLKTRLSLFISLLVGFMLVLNLFFNDFFIRQALEKQYDRFTENVAVQTVKMYEMYRNGEAFSLETAYNHLQLATRVASEMIGGTAPDAERLQVIKEQTGVTELEVLERVPDGLTVRATTIKEGAGSSDKQELSDELAQKEGFYLDRTPLAKRSLISGYYISGSSPLVVRAAIPSRGLGPEQMIQHVIQYEPQVLELGIWKINASGTPDLIYGNGAFFEDQSEQALLSANKPKLRHSRVPGTDIMRSSYPFQSDGAHFILSMAVNRIDVDYLSRIHARSELTSFFGMFLLLMLGTWLIIRSSLKPLRLIVGKVGEVAAGRFDTPLEANRRDEIGELAHQINIMSRNLSRHTGELRAASEENAKIKEQLESIIQNTADCIVILGLDCRIIKVNRAFCQLFGYTEEEALQHSIPELLHPENHRFKKRDVARLLEGEPLAAAEEDWRRKDGEYIRVSSSLSAIRNGAGEVWALAAVLRDISSKSQMEELLRRSEKLTTVGQLAAGVAHEIRNPLTTLRGFLQLQQESGKLNLRHNDIMLAELDRINLIVSEFLILAKPQATRFQVKDVRFVLGDVVSLLDSEGHLKNVVFHTRFAAESCLVSCEENQLKQVFINIIKNAIEAMPQGGNVYFDISRPTDHEVAICIIDEGVGIPEDIIPRIGDPFFTAKETGTGLGIMVSQRIIQAHKGTMSIASKLGEGTAITLVLPAFQEK